MKTIEIIINASGQLTINAAGFKGADCEQATAFLEQTLGKVSQKQRKPEYFQRARARTVQKVGQ
jgi:hypothetical protein